MQTLLIFFSDLQKFIFICLYSERVYLVDRSSNILMKSIVSNRLMTITSLTFLELRYEIAITY